MNNVVRFLFFFVLFLSCSIDPVVHDSESRGDYFAYCTLAPYSEKQTVLVGRTVVESLPRFYSDAEVILSGVGRTSIFVHTQNGIYEEAPPYLHIVGDSTYHLSVRFPEGHLIEAETRVPGDFNIIEPQPNDTLFYQIGSRQYPTINMQLPTVNWTSSNAAYYYDAATETDEICGTDVVYTNYTKIYIPYNPYICYNFPSTSEYYTKVRLVVTAIDSSRGFKVQRRSFVADSLDYDLGFNRMDEGLINTKKMNFKGGKGFFNAVNRAQRSFILHVKIVESLPQHKIHDRMYRKE